MSDIVCNAEERIPALQFHFLGSVSYEECWALQRRLVKAARPEHSADIVVLLCEHPTLITIGRRGSRGHIAATDEELQRRELTVRWEARGGGCVMHAPGQLAIYPLLSLVGCRWSVGDYARRLRHGVSQTLQELNLTVCDIPGTWGLAGRTGPLATMGVSVRGGMTSLGMWLNVQPQLADFKLVSVLPPSAAAMRPTMSSLAAERQGNITMPRVRATLVSCLSEALERPRYYLHTGHPGLKTWREAARGSSHARAC